MASHEQLKEAFLKFAVFGNRGTQHEQVMMDSRAAQKLCKDAGLTGKKLTTTDIDLLFASTKNKGERKIGFSQFLRLVNGFATKLSRSHAEVSLQIANCEPKMNVSAVISAMSSPASTSGSSNFDSPAPSARSNSAPKAMARLHPDWYEVQNPNPSPTQGAFYYVNRLTNETTWNAPLITPSEEINVPPPPPSSDYIESVGASSSLQDAFHSLNLEQKEEEEQQQQGLLTPTSSEEVTDKNNNMNADNLENRNLHTPVREKRPSIFDKLTDPKLYTGAHRHRFDLDTGKGKGLDGRDRMIKGTGATASTPKSSFKGNTNTGTNETVHSISQVLRGK